ncbi:MAG: TVP38/TMEM64 family protein [Oscillospiraceae bacterium]|nr:TVP38/TMEM64 family protein [Oscillospiraceae bacterium]
MKVKNKKTFKIVSFVIFAVVIAFLTIVCIPLAKMLISEEGRAQLEAIIANDLGWGIVIFLVLQVLQVIVALIPGGVIQILGGVLFGGFWGTILCILGILLGTVIIYVMVKNFGKPLVEAVFDEKVVKRFSFLQDSKKLELVIFILFLIPGIPKDLLTYVAPLTPIKMTDFLLLSTLARIPAIIMSTVFGSSLSDGNIFTAIVIFVIVAVLGIVGILYKDKLLNVLRNLKRK